MSAVWGGLRRSRMALLAVNALLMKASNCRAAVGASSVASGVGTSGHMITLARSIVSLPHSGTDMGSSDSGLGAATTQRSSALKRRIPFSRRRSEAVGVATTSKPSVSMMGNPCGQDTTTATTTTTTITTKSGRRAKRNELGIRRHARRLVIPMWVHAREVIPSKKDALWGKLSRAREAAAASSADKENAPEQQEQQGQQWAKQLGGGWNQWRQKQQQQQEEKGFQSKITAAMVKTLVKVPSKPTPPSPAATAAPADEELATAPSLVSSYLQWSNPNQCAAEPLADQKQNQREKLPQLQRGIRRGGAESGDGLATPSAGSGGTLGTAKSSRGGASAVSLSFTEAMVAGAVSRSIAQTCMQPANVVKTLLQGRGTASQLSNLSFKLLTRGAGAQFLLSMPHGAFNFATLEIILGCSAKIFPTEWRERAGPALDFISSSVATLVCSVVSTPQMVVTDRIMAGMYPNLASGIREISRTEGLKGFYTGWSANVAQKIPSYGLTWVFFQQFKRLHRKTTERPPTNTENFLLGAAAAGATVCIMIPMDTVKTRLVTQTAQAGVVPYRGVIQTLSRVVREEGVGSMYRSLTPRLVSVVPMIGIQFGIYEFLRKEFMSRKESDHKTRSWLPPVVRKTFGMGGDLGSLQPDYVKDFLRNVYLLEEELV